MWKCMIRPFYVMLWDDYAVCIRFLCIFSEILLSTGKGGNEKATEVLQEVTDMES